MESKVNLTLSDSISVNHQLVSFSTELQIDTQWQLSLWLPAFPDLWFYVIGWVIKVNTNNDGILKDKLQLFYKNVTEFSFSLYKNTYDQHTCKVCKVTVITNYHNLFPNISIKISFCCLKAGDIAIKVNSEMWTKWFCLKQLKSFVLFSQSFFPSPGLPGKSLKKIKGPALSMECI